MNGTLLSCQVETIQTRRDNTIKIVFGTQEISPSRAAELLSLMNKIVAVYISPKESIAQKELDQIDKIDPEFTGKTQSQRIRNVLYKLFEQNSEGFKDFDQYYKNKTELYIEHLKSKIQ